MVILWLPLLEQQSILMSHSPFSRNCRMWKRKEAAIIWLVLVLWMHEAAFCKPPCVSSVVRASPSAKSAEVLGGCSLLLAPRYLLLPCGWVWRYQGGLESTCGQAGRHLAMHIIKKFGKLDVRNERKLQLSVLACIVAFVVIKPAAPC